MAINRGLIEEFYNGLDERSREALDAAVNKVVEAKKRGGKVAVVTGSGPNLHEGVTTLIAELITKGVVDGVTTSSAVVNHEMGGALDRLSETVAPQFAESLAQEFSLSFDFFGAEVSAPIFTWRTLHKNMRVLRRARAASRKKSCFLLYFFVRGAIIYIT